MRGDKKYSIRVRVSESMKVRIQAEMLKRDCSEAEVIRRLLKKNLQSNVSSARSIINKSNKATQYA